MIYLNRALKPTLQGRPAGAQGLTLCKCETTPRCAVFLYKLSAYLQEITLAVPSGPHPFLPGARKRLSHPVRTRWTLDSRSERGRYLPHPPARYRSSYPTGTASRYVLPLMLVSPPGT